jgi:general secretion pathway protein G
MTQHVLGYFGPGPDVRRRRPSPWLVAGATVALVCFFFFLLAAPKIHGRTDDARIAAAQTDIVNYSTVVDAFASDTGRYPTDAEGLAALASPSGELPGWKGPYVQLLKWDSWGRPYIYHLGGPKGGAGYRIVSMGPDGKEGTADDIMNGSDAAPIRIGAPVASAPSTQPW